MTTYGVHAGLQKVAAGELIELYKRIEDLGYGWISVWDHFYAADMTGDAECLEAVSMHAALALSTTKVRCGSLVYSVGYRHPAVLANAIATIDHLSGGRTDVGLGAGWSQMEYDAYGIPFPSVGTRMSQLEEGIQVLRGLLHDEVSTFEGKWFQLREARNEPRPVQAQLPIWVGGGGEKKTLRIAAQYADGWNVPFISPEEFARKRGILHQHCDDVGREPAEVRCTVNVGMAYTEDSLVEQFGRIAEMVRPGVLFGTDEQMLDRIGQYVDAGAEQINIAMRAPFDPDALERFAKAVGIS
ncbi:MAG TPA: TIGR03560 family F420-dependent LLM class oxidoreductase [Acidimicrobiales bacterium]|nr:TIGR03560 family F420-dependent LLM class oxidoreductase [Acidimicrobiales bacterium]